jgi:putative transposase
VSEVRRRLCPQAEAAPRPARRPLASGRDLPSNQRRTAVSLARVDQDGDVIDILVQPRRDRRAAERFFRRLLRGQGQQPLRIITDRLRSYSAAMRTSFCNVAHTTERYANNRMEASHQPTRQRERQMRRFKSTVQAQRFLSLHGVVHNLFRLGRHLIRPKNYRFLRSRSFWVWRTVTAR